MDTALPERERHAVVKKQLEFRRAKKDDLCRRVFERQQALEDVGEEDREEEDSRG